MTSDVKTKQPTPEQVEDCKRRLRLEIAQDVIDQLPNTNAQTGSFCSNASGVSFDIVDDSRQMARKLYENCRVCALGAAFISLIKKRGNFDFRENIISGFKNGTIYGRSIINRLNSCFSNEQLMLIENAFETGTGSAVYRPRVDFGVNDDNFRLSVGYVQSMRFGQQFYEDHKRLKAIMDNIISNDGQFIPTKGAHAVSE